MEKELFLCRHGTWRLCSECHGTKQSVIEMPNDEYWLNGQRRQCVFCGGIGWRFEMDQGYDFLSYVVKLPCSCLDDYLESSRRPQLRVVNT